MENGTSMGKVFHTWNLHLWSHFYLSRDRDMDKNDFGDGEGDRKAFSDPVPSCSVAISNLIDIDFFIKRNQYQSFHMLMYNYIDNTDKYY